LQFLLLQLLLDLLDGDFIVVVVSERVELGLSQSLLRAQLGLLPQLRV
jgi:hypothetical protein